MLSRSFSSEKSYSPSRLRCCQATAEPWATAPRNASRQIEGPETIEDPDGKLVTLAGARMIVAGQVDHRDSELKLPRYILDIPPVESARREESFSPL
jgi:hypothetical protein